MRIPCIKCNEDIWAYVRPYLIEWGYVDHTYPNWCLYYILVINDSGDLGICNNYFKGNEIGYNRELVKDVEEFLERAAALKGFSYNRKDCIEICDIKVKPGMVLVGEDTNGKIVNLVAFPTQNGIGFCTAVSERVCWTTDYKSIISKLLEIHDLIKSSHITSGTLLWKASH